MRNPLPCLATAFVLLSLVSPGCKEDTAGPSDLRATFLQELSGDVIRPTYRDFATRSEELATALAALEAQPSEATLVEAQARWRATRAAWKHQEAFQFGPVESLHTQALVDQQASVPGIDQLIAGSAPLTEASVAELGANRKGLLCMEYLLFDAEGGNAAVLARLTGAGPPGERRRAYLKALGAVLRADGVAVHDAWEPSGGNYAGELASAGSGSSQFDTQKEAVDAVVNRLIFSAEAAELKLARPLGRDSGGTVRPELEEARRSDNSVQDLLDVLQGVERVWQGPSGQGGLSRLVAASNGPLAGRVRADLTAVRESLEAIPPPLRTALTGSPESVEEAREAWATLRATLSSEVVANLGVTLSFNDNDGD